MILIKFCIFNQLFYLYAQYVVGSTIAVDDNIILINVLFNET